MYDLAKRSLAFAVATGGLLLTGTALSPALAVAGSGAIQGQAQAQGVRIDADHASSPVNAAHRDATVTAGVPARAAQAPPGSLPPDVLRSHLSAPGVVAALAGTPIPVCADAAGASIVRGETARTYCVTGSGTAAGAASAADAGAPAPTLIEVCGNTVTAGPIESFESGSSCTNTAEGSAPTVPGAPAPGPGGASATAVSVNDGGADAAMPKILGRSGGAGSADTAPLGMNAPLTVCGDTAQATDTDEDGHGGKCAASPSWPGTAPSPSPCKCSATSPIHSPPPPPPPAPTRHPWKCDCPHTSPIQPSSPPPPPAPSRHPWKCGCAHTLPTSPPPPPPTKCGCWHSPPPSSPPPPPSSPPPSRSWPPSWPSGSPSPSPSSPSWHHPGGPPHNGNGGGLAHTGTDIGIALGAAGAALLGGLGLRAAARRREGRS